jgi:hypothetical protein
MIAVVVGMGFSSLVQMYFYPNKNMGIEVKGQGKDES